MADANVVGQLFHEMRSQYGPLWMTQFKPLMPEDRPEEIAARVMAAWRKELAPYGRGVIRQALDAAKRSFVDYPPLLGQFAALCRQIQRRDERLADRQRFGRAVDPDVDPLAVPAGKAMLRAWRMVAWRGKRYVGIDGDESREYLLMLQLRLLRAAGESLPAALKRVMKGR